MARAERPLDEGEGPLLSLAADLRKLRREAGSPAYRELARRAHFAAGTLSEAAGGRKLPSLEVTLAYVRACDGDPEQWRERWFAVAAELHGDPANPPPAEAPYVGLAAFGTADADRFFGREELLAELTERVAGHRCVVLTGPSGSGKSSLLRAGLLHQAKGSPTLLLTPGPRPVQELAVRLADFAGLGAVELARALAEPEALHLTVLQALADREGDLLLVVDQFEEVFTLRADPAERDRFLELLLTAARAVNSRVRIVLGVRADFYAHCAALPGLVEVLRTAQVLLGPMSTEQLRAVITQPALRAGCRVEPDLVTQILLEASGEAAVLPLVSHALRETWARRKGTMLTLAGYQATGGISQAIARTAEAVYAELTAGQQDWARRLFVRLVALGEGTEDTGRRLDRAELEPAEPVVLERLAAARLISLEQDGVRIGHEALIRNWQRLRQWLAEDREALRRHRQLTEATALWESLDHDPGALYRGARLAMAADLPPESLTGREREFLRLSRTAARRRRRFGRALVAVLTVLLLVSGSATVYAVRAENAMARQRDAALAHKVAGAAVALHASSPEQAAKLAIAAHRLSPSAETADSLRSALAVPLAGHTDAVTGTVFSADGRRLATSAYDRTVRLWDLTDPLRPKKTGTLTGHTGPVLALALSPDGRTLASAGADRTIRLWDPADPQRPPTVLSGHTGSVVSLAFSPDGRALASGGYDHTVRVWELATGAASTLTAHTLNVKRVVFSPDGRTLASAGDDRTVRLWRLDDPRQPVERAVLTGHTDFVVSLAFSPDGRTLASGGDDRTIRLWDPADPARAPVELPGHTNVVAALAFSPDGRTLASGGYDQTVRLWAGGRSLATLSGHTSAVFALAFAPDGHTLATGSHDRTAQLWETDLALAETRACAQPALSAADWAQHFPEVGYRVPC
ncbi:NACHT domain-containing protein [Crossiella sp. CA-258035]|uniref:nSTAND1 domain-containing NTPase n=1 Tax=Crossiella sp. CA-258035 TaxID=2981138 RepID=UPI0024BC9B63|nr:AAA family ATPase [Crossiella sp. CA-258035]WHT16731.1 NACHT domain-containing protein [Crossiella sp. CA-258035]